MIKGLINQFNKTFLVFAWGYIQIIPPSVKYTKTFIHVYVHIQMYL